MIRYVHCLYGAGTALSRSFQKAREMVEHESLCPTPSHPRGSHAVPRERQVRRIEPLSAVKRKKELYDHNSCVTRASRFPFWTKEEVDTQTSPHVPCLRLIDRAGISFP